MISARHSRLTFLLTVLVLLSRAPRAVADDVADEADLHFRLGAQRYEARDFQGALEHFLLSNRLVPNKNVLFNIARAYEQLHQAPNAFRYYQQAQGAETNEAERRRIQAALDRVAPAVAIVDVETVPPGATIYLDRKDLGPRGTTPRRLGLAPGRHKVIVELDGHEAAESAVLDLALGKETTVRLPLNAILGSVALEGQPIGVRVRVDDEGGPVRCTTPCAFDVSPGRHALFFSKDGYVSSEATVFVERGRAVTVRPKLVPLMGGLVVNADVRDALITVDDKPSGFTPAVLSVPAGRHTVRVFLAGFRPFESTVDVAGNEQARLDVQLAAREEVTAASRFSEAVEDAPASVTIVSREELRAMGYPTIAEAVRGVRGIFLSDDTSYVSVGVRGIGRPGDYGNKILVLIDGHPANDDYIWSSYVGFDGRVDLEDIDRIEVVRGPGSVLYGTSAFFAVINLVTRDRHQPTHGEVGLGTAQDGVFRARAAAQVALGKDAGFWLSTAAARGTGRDFYFPEIVANPADPSAEKGANGLPVDGNARGVDGFTATTQQGRLWVGDFTVQWFLTSRRKSLPSGEYGTVFGDARAMYNDTRGFVEARYEPALSPLVQSLSRAHLDLYNFDDFEPYPDSAGGVSRDRFRGRFGGLEQRFVLTPSAALRLTLGGAFISHFETRQEGSNSLGPYVFDDKGNPGRNDPFVVGAGYAMADWTALPRLKLSVGARLDDYSNLKTFDVGAALSPRVGVIWKPYDGGNLKVLFGKAFRAPSVYELHFVSTTQVAPKDLQPERVYSGEVELTHHFSTTVSGIVAGYTNFVDQLIELETNANGLLVYANAKTPVSVVGAEAEVRREFRKGYMVAATYSLQVAQYWNAPTLRSVPNSPTHLASLKGAAPILGRALVAMTRLTVEGPRPDRNDSVTAPPQQMTSGGLVWDLVFSGEVEAVRARYAVGCYNIADSRYATVPSAEFRQRTIVQSGRTVMASVNVSF